MLIDSHCHLSFKDYADTGIDDILKRARENDVGTMITIGAGEEFEGNTEALKISNQHYILHRRHSPPRRKNCNSRNHSKN